MVPRHRASIGKGVQCLASSSLTAARDTSGHAGHLAADLIDRFGRSSVFMDVDSIPVGEEFENPIQHALDSCQVALVLIGDDWLASTSSGEQRRIDKNDDWVRNEVAAALKRSDVRVIPILVEGATMPSPSELPSEISRISKIEACELSNRRWKYDFERLYESVKDVGPRGRIGPAIRDAPGWAKAGVSATLGGVAAAVILLGTGGGSSSSCANQVIPPDLRGRLSVADGTRRPAVPGSVFYGACGGTSWAIAQFPGGGDGVFKQTGFSWTKLGSIASAECLIPSDLRDAWNLGGC